MIRPDVRLVDAAALEAREVAAWERLADAAAEPNPFARPGFVLAAAGGRAEPAALLVVREGPRWVAALPVRRVLRRRGVPLPCLAPWLPFYAFLDTPLLHAERLEPAAAALAALVARGRASAGLLLDPVDADGPVVGALGSALAERGTPLVVLAEYERAALRRRPEATYLTEAVSGAGRKKLRSRARALARELGGDLHAVDRSDDEDAAAAFLALEHAGWKGRRGTSLLSDPGDAAFFRAMCAAMRDAGRLQILALEAAGRTAAMQINLLDGGHLLAFKVAYDEALARFSPGALLEVEGMEAFHRSGAVLADSCADPDSRLVNRLWPDRRRLQALVVPAGARQRRLLAAGARAEGAARRLRGGVLRRAAA